MRFKYLFKHKIGLALAGGGAKGAYQVGVFQAMHELEINHLVKAVSGTSIGALNGALFLLDDPKVWDETWNDADFDSFLHKKDKDETDKPKKTIKDLSGILKKSLAKLEDDWDKSSSMSDFLLKQNLSMFSQEGLRNVIEKHVDFKKISKDKTNLYACAYNIDLLEPEYFHLNKRDEKTAQDILLASSCIPFMYEPVEIGQYRYMDGGIKSPFYKKENIDKIPVKPLYDEKCDIIIVIYLNHEDKIDFDPYKKILGNPDIIEIYPTMSLEDFKGTGTFDFTQSNLEERFELGYHDAMLILAPMIVKLFQGKNFNSLIKRHNEYNEKIRKKHIKEKKKKQKK